MPVPASSATRFASALLVPLRWASVLVAVVFYIVVVPIIELASEFLGLLRRAFVPWR